jgi:tRNA A-37 threonylcarbamoyl transferase component Bud32/membrane-associated phospholipid phosphatase
MGPGRIRRSVSEQRAIRKRRRPSGEPPPLPRSLGRSGHLLVGLSLALGAIVILVLGHVTVGAWFDRQNTSLLRALATIRTGWLNAMVLWVDRLLASRATIGILRLGTLVAVVVFRRWRHLLAFLISVVAVEAVVYELSILVAVARPVGVLILGSWSGFSFPSAPMAALAVTLVGMVYVLLPAGPTRAKGMSVALATMAVFAASRLYLALDNPTDVVGALILGVTIPVVAFRFVAPNDVFPVTYRSGRTAHLDVSGRRGDAIKAAVQDQLGLTVLDLRPVGLEGSGGSTPLRLSVTGGVDAPVRNLFAKLYATNHVRADRWYKLGRAILYGALEDEAPFQNVRRFAEYEDYTLLLLRNQGVAVPEPFGIVEITPEREYLIVMEFFDGAREIGEADVDDGVINEGLGLIRQLWDAGVAHRDIKPANLMVRDGKVLLIDVFFVQVRPSPWRQAVDLANMMLVLALRSDSERVYRAALRCFTEDDIAEAFAATRGVATPTQLRVALKRDGRDLPGRFRAMAPGREPVAIQRWSARRVSLALAASAAAVLVFALVIANWRVVL